MFYFLTEWYVSNERCQFVWKIIICVTAKATFQFCFRFFTREGVKGDFGRKPLIMDAKIQIFQIEGKNLKKKKPGFVVTQIM